MDSNVFVERLNMTNSVEEMHELFGQYGVKVSMEELNKMVNSIKVGAGGELNEDALDNVAGGGWFQKFWDWLCTWNTEGTNDVVNLACGK